MPKVSVVVSIYNGEKYLEETIQTVINQTYQDWELILANDQSSDDSLKVAEAYAKKYPGKILAISTPNRCGAPAGTKNFGVTKATGEFVAFLDQDDLWESDKLEKQVAYLDFHPEVNILGCNVRIISSNKMKVLGDFWRDPSQVTNETIRKFALTGPIFATTSCMIVRRNYFHTHSFDTNYIGADEYDLYLHAILDNSTQVSLQEETLTFWRWHSTSLSHSDRAAIRSLEDEKYFTNKVLSRGDLTEEEASVVRERLLTVKRRAANALYAKGNRQEARQIYHEVLSLSSSDQGLIKLILRIDRFAPFVAAWIIQLKKAISFSKPEFR